VTLSGSDASSLSPREVTIGRGLGVLGAVAAGRVAAAVGLAGSEVSLEGGITLLTGTAVSVRLASGAHAARRAAANNKGDTILEYVKETSSRPEPAGAASN
jgi:hypothetical protein